MSRYHDLYHIGHQTFNISFLNLSWAIRFVCRKCFAKSFNVFHMRNMYGIYDVLCQQLTFYAVFTLWRDCPQQLSKKNVNKDNAKFGYQISYLFSLFITFLWDISCYFITNPSKITRRVIAFTNKIHPYLECCFVIWEETNLLICFNHSILTKYLTIVIKKKIILIWFCKEHLDENKRNQELHFWFFTKTFRIAQNL